MKMAGRNYTLQRLERMCFAGGFTIWSEKLWIWKKKSSCKKKKLWTLLLLNTITTEKERSISRRKYGNWKVIKDNTLELIWLYLLGNITRNKCNLIGTITRWSGVQEVIRKASFSTEKSLKTEAHGTRYTLWECHKPEGLYQNCAKC